MIKLFSTGLIISIPILRVFFIAHISPLRAIRVRKRSQFPIFQSLIHTNWTFLTKMCPHLMKLISPFILFLSCIKNPLSLVTEGVLELMSWRWLTLTWVTPHYHQRKEVSLLSSGRDQVVHSCYCRQHNCLWLLAMVLITLLTLRCA